MKHLHFTQLFKWFICLMPVIQCTLVFASKTDTVFTEFILHIETTKGGQLEGVLRKPDVSNGTVVLIIAGSGPTDRDGNNPAMQNNSLKQLAEGLALAGIASFRYDKRGVGNSAGAAKKESDLRFEDYVSDAKDCIRALKTHAFKTIVVLGHSEGSLIGMLAAEGVHAFISVAGAGKPADEILKEQLKTQPDIVKTECYAIIDSLKTGKLYASPSTYLYSLFRPEVQPYLMSWFAYNPQKAIAGLNIPVLIIQGSNDLQVGMADAALLNTACTDSKLSIIKDMNHVLKTIAPEDQAANVASYSNPELPLSEELLQVLQAFILPL